MAALNLLRLTQGPSLLSISKVPCNIPGRNISKKKLLQQLNLPQQPKKPPTAFVLFFQEIKDDIKNQNSGSDGEDLLKRAASLWKNLSVEKKEQYQNKFKTLKKRYSEDMEKFEAKLTPQQKTQLESFNVHFQNIKEIQASTLMRREKEKEFNKPKHPTPPYVRFVQEVRPSGISIKEAWKAAKEKWDQLPDGTKEKYRAKFKEELEQYKKDLEAWEKEMIKMGHADIVRPKTLKRKMLSNET